MSTDLAAAYEFYCRGERVEAERACQSALSENPQNHQALNLLGLIRSEAGDPAFALPLLQRAVELAPDSPLYRADLAHAFLSLSQPEPALEQALAALALGPQSAELCSNLAVTFSQLNRLDQAVLAGRRAVELDPRLVPARVNLAHALNAIGEGDEALGHLQKARALEPSNADVSLNLSQLLMHRGELGEAFPLAISAAKQRPDFAPALLNLSQILMLLGRLHEAELCLGETLHFAPRQVQAHATLGSVREQRGDLQGSIDAYRAALELDPTHAGSLGRLATRLRGSLPEGERARIDALLANPALAPEARRPLAFGMAQVADALGDVERASALAAVGNQIHAAELSKRGRAYRAAEHDAYLDQISDAFSPEHFARTKGFGLDSECPVFVFGLPRSGTSLIEQILASHSAVFGAGELTLINEAFHADHPPERPIVERISALDRTTVQRLATTYLDHLTSFAPAAARIVDKMPENFQHLGLITTLFPRARLIHCKRDLRDVALSCWLNDFAAVRWSSRIDDLIAHFRGYEPLMTHWSRVLPVRIHTVEYERLVGDNETEARRLIAHCGLDWQPACLEFHRTKRDVRTASVAQVRQPLYASSVGRWRRYQKPLARLFAALVPEELADF